MDDEDYLLICKAIVFVVFWLSVGAIIAHIVLWR
jgi:hypothetical protein